MSVGYRIEFPKVVLFAPINPIEENSDGIILVAVLVDSTELPIAFVACTENT